MDISEVFDAVSQELGAGHASAEFRPFSELKHTWRVDGKSARFKVSDYLKDESAEVIESLAWYLVPVAFRRDHPRPESGLYLARIRSKQFWMSKRAIYIARARNLSTDPKGKHRDLESVFDYVNSTYFRNGIVDPTLAWVAESPARRLGYYFEPLNLLAVNRVFDSERVPRFALEFVVYHELLHHIDAESGRRAKRVHHTRSFREQEQRFSSYLEAERWLNKLVSEHRRRKDPGGVPRA